MLCNANSIRDVIAFPKSATGRDLLVSSPAAVTNEQLDEYKIALAKEWREVKKDQKIVIIKEYTTGSSNVPFQVHISI